jgi:GH43 family beta-xylosidase
LFSSAARPTNAASFSPYAILVNSTGADPWVIQHGGALYYTQTTGSEIKLWIGSDLCSLRDAKPFVIWHPFYHHGIHLKNLWAPEIHAIGGSWYLYVAADDGRNKNHRMYVLESLHGPLGPYEMKGKLSNAAHDRWAIDGTVTTIDGALYYAWSGWPRARNGRQNLYMCRMHNPWTLDDSIGIISQPEHPWESWINEGPQFLHRGPDTFIVYSANKSWTDDYKLGLLRLEGRDPLCPKSWRKVPTPIFDSVPHAEDPVYAPGHCSFLTDSAERNWLIYHVAKTKGAGWSREVRAQQWVWNEHGDPFFGHPLPVQRTGPSLIVSDDG